MSVETSAASPPSADAQQIRKNLRSRIVAPLGDGWSLSKPIRRQDPFFTNPIIIFLNRCVGCEAWLEKENSFLICLNCWSRLHFLNTTAFLPGLNKQYFDEAFSCVAYEGLALDWIHQYKYSRKLYLGKTLSHLLSEKKLDWSDYDALTYVPLHWWRLFRRGFNPSHFLAYALGKKIQKPLISCLKRNRSTPPQTKLSREERLKNVKGGFEISKNGFAQLKEKNFLLIDDVLTTGATLNECAKVLKKAGAKKVNVLTLARTL